MDTPIFTYDFVNDKMAQSQESSAANGFLMFVGAKENEIGTLKYVPLIVHFYWLLAETCDLRVSKEDYFKLTMKEVVEKVDKEGQLCALWDKFKECWMRVKDSVHEQGCNAQIGAEGEIADISDETLLCSVMGVGSEGTDSIIKTLRDGLGKLQDEFVEKFEAGFGNKLNHFLQFLLFVFLRGSQQTRVLVCQ